MKVALFAFFLSVGLTAFAQRPMLTPEHPIEFSKNFNNGNFIIDYLIEEQAAINLYLKNDSLNQPIYLLKMKAVSQGQYELEVNKSLMKPGTTYVNMEWNGKVAEASYIIEEIESSDEESEENE